MRIAMIATVYGGFISTACFADCGRQGTCIDEAEDEINGLEASP